MLISPQRSVNWLEVVTVLLVIGGAVGVGVAIALDQSQWLVLIAVGLGVAAVTVQRPAVGAALILALAPLEGVVLVAGNSAIKLVTVFCLGVLVLRELVARKGFKLDQITGLTTLFVGWAFMTILWTSKQSTSLSNWMSFTLQSLLYVLLLNLITSPRDLKLALWGHVLGGLVLTIIVTNTLIAHDFLRREHVAGLGINLAARLVAISLLLTIMLRQFEVRRLLRLVLLLSAVLLAVGVVVALSRGAWYGVAVSLALVVFLRGRRNFSLRQVLLWGLAGVAIYYILSQYVFNEHGLFKLVTRVQSSFSFSDNAANRFDIWKVGGAMFLDAPIWGHGFDSFSREFRFYAAAAGLPDSFNQGQGKEAHNAYVLVVAELGLIGLLLFLSILASGFRTVWRALRESKTNSLALAWGMALLAFLIMSSFVDGAVDRKYPWYLLSLTTLIVRYLHQPPTANVVAETPASESPVALPAPQVNP